MTALNPQDAERGETLALEAKIAGDEYEHLLQRSQELTLKISRVRIDYLRKLRRSQEFNAAMAGMTVKA